MHVKNVCHLQVKAFQTFSTHGPQKYALAVLGKYSGILASPGNPANGGSVQTGACHVIVTAITGGPNDLINQRWGTLHAFLNRKKSSSGPSRYRK